MLWFGDVGLSWEQGQGSAIGDVHPWQPPGMMGSGVGAEPGGPGLLGVPKLGGFSSMSQSPGGAVLEPLGGSALEPQGFPSYIPTIQPYSPVCHSPISGGSSPVSRGHSPGIPRCSAPCPGAPGGAGGASALCPAVRVPEGSVPQPRGGNPVSRGPQSRSPGGLSPLPWGIQPPSPAAPCPGGSSPLSRR